MNARVLIVGAGIAGLATARALGERGFSPEVIERLPAWNQAGTGIYLPGNASRALGGLGLDAKVAERAVVITRQRFSNHRGRVLADIDLHTVWSAVGPCVALPWADLHEVLRADVPLRMGVGVRSLAQQDGEVDVEFMDGTRGTYDLVIGADGIHSVVRALVFDAWAVRSVGQVGWRFVTRAPAEAPAWSVLLGRRSAFLTIPIAADRVYCYCDRAGQAGPADPRELFSDFAEPVPTLLASLGDRDVDHVGAIEEVVLDSWSSGSVLLIGDAAHATSPNMAEGAAMALEDALVIASSLATSRSVESAIAAFTARRRPRTDWVLTQTHRRDRTRGLPPAIRDPLMRVLGSRIYRANYAPLLDEP